MLLFSKLPQDDDTSVSPRLIQQVQGKGNEGSWEPALPYSPQSMASNS